MIQYQYFHTGDGYVSRLSLSMDDSKYRVAEDTFEKLRRAIDGDAFAYASVGTKGLFLQANMSATPMCINGILCDTAPDVPAKYIYKFDAKPASADVERLPEGQMPALGRRQEGLELATDLHHVFAKLIDALLYGEQNKRIVIVADDRNSRVNYMKVLGMLLPLSYMKKVGFCIDTCGIPYDAMTVTGNDGVTEEISVRIWLPNLESFDYNSYAPVYHVFDVRGGEVRDNYSRELSPIAKAIDELDLGDRSVAQDFINKMQSAFTNEGEADFEKLDRMASIWLMEKNRDPAAAKQVLNLRGGDESERKEAVKSAIAILLDPANAKEITSDVRGAILREYKNDSDIAQEIGEALFNHLVAVYASLNKDEQDVLLQMIAEDESGERLHTVLDGEKRDYAMLRASFETAFRVLRMRVEKHGARAGAHRVFIQEIAATFAINNIRGLLLPEHHSQGEEFFSIVGGMGDEPFRALAYAILMVSAYSVGAPAPLRAIRIQGLLGMLNSLGNDPVAKINTLLAVREAMIGIARSVPELRADDTLSRFLIDTPLGLDWANRLIGGMSIEKLIDTYHLVYGRTIDHNYASFLSVITDRLLDMRLVREHVRTGLPVFGLYKRFFETLDTALKERHGEIRQYLEALDSESEISDKLQKYRCDFTYGCYKTLSKADRQKVYKDELSAFGELPRSEQTVAVENTIRVFGMTRRVRTSMQAPSDPFLLWAACFGFLAELLLFLPAFVQCLVLGTFDFASLMNKTAAYVAPGVATIPIAVALLTVVSYLTLRGKKRMKKAIMITILCGLLPLLAFALSYLIFYFLK